MVQLTRQQWVREFFGEGTESLMRVTRVARCGARTAADVEAVNACEAEVCGFLVNMPQSALSVTPDELRRLSVALDPAIVAVGIFADEPVASVAGLVEAGVIDAVQLQGSEDEAYVTELRRSCDAPIVREFNMAAVA